MDEGKSSEDAGEGRDPVLGPADVDAEDKPGSDDSEDDSFPGQNGGMRTLRDGRARGGGVIGSCLIAGMYPTNTTSLSSSSARFLPLDLGAGEGSSDEG